MDINSKLKLKSPKKEKGIRDSPSPLLFSNSTFNNINIKQEIDEDVKPRKFALMSTYGNYICPRHCALSKPVEVKVDSDTASTTSEDEKYNKRNIPRILYDAPDNKSNNQASRFKNTYHLPNVRHKNKRYKSHYKKKSITVTAEQLDKELDECFKRPYAPSEHSANTTNKRSLINNSTDPSNNSESSVNGPKKTNPIKLNKNFPLDYNATNELEIIGYCCMICEKEKNVQVIDVESGRDISNVRIRKRSRCSSRAESVDSHCLSLTDCTENKSVNESECSCCTSSYCLSNIGSPNSSVISQSADSFVTIE